MRIGYLSAHFREHAVPHVIAGILEIYDRNRFPIAAYSYGPDDNSPMRDRVVAAIRGDPERNSLRVPLFDSDGYTACLQSACEMIWEHYRSSGVSRILTVEPRS